MSTATSCSGLGVPFCARNSPKSGWRPPRHARRNWSARCASPAETVVEGLATRAVASLIVPVLLLEFFGQTCQGPAILLAARVGLAAHLGGDFFPGQFLKHAQLYKLPFFVTESAANLLKEIAIGQRLEHGRAGRAYIRLLFAAVELLHNRQQ